MAGIGFRLQKLLKEDSYKGLISAYLYSALISTGPWLLSVFGLAILSIFSHWFLTTELLLTFRAIVIYCYAGSLILTGIFQLGTTRYVADRLFVKDYESIAPCYHFVGAVVLLTSGLTGFVFFHLSSLDEATRLGAILLFQSVSLTWIGMIFLSAAKDYLAIVRAFGLCQGLSVVAGLSASSHFGVAGMTWGYALGQVALAWLLAVRIRVEFPAREQSSPTVISHWRKLPYLAAIGVLYNLGIWIDKFIFWYGSDGVVYGGILHTAPRYDTCMYIAYLTIVPSMSLFLIRIETGFYKHYAAFFHTITSGSDLDTIEDCKGQMIDALRLSVLRLVKMQGLITFVCFLAAPALLETLGVLPASLPLFRIALLSAFLQVLLLILLVLILYFDWQADVFRISLLFVVSNAALTASTLFLPVRYNGLGYFLSCLISLLIGLYIFEKRLQLLEFDTFTKQPIRG